MQYLQPIPPSEPHSEPQNQSPIQISSNFTIGRTHDNSLQILDNSISKKHAKISLLKEAFYLYDLESANGIYVNGIKVEGEVKIVDGDEIQFGKWGWLYKFVDKERQKVKGKGKGKINLKDYLFEESLGKGEKIETNGKPKVEENEPSKISIKKKKDPSKPLPKESRIKIPDITDYLRLVEEPQTNHEVVHISGVKTNQQSRNNMGEEKIRLGSLDEMPNLQNIKELKLDKREKNIFLQEQEALKIIEEQRRRVEEEKLRKELEQAKIAEDLLEKQLILEQRVREEQEKVEEQKLKLEQEFVVRDQLRREEELSKIRQIEEKEKEMIRKIEDERVKQIEELKAKEEHFKKESENQYRNEYEKRKRELEIEAEALAKQYENIYRETIRKVRTQIDTEENTLQKMEQSEHRLNEESEKLSRELKTLENEIVLAKNQFIQISGRNKACVIYASSIQDKIDSMGGKEFKEQQKGYASKSEGGKILEGVMNSRKLLRIKEKEHRNLQEEIMSLKAQIKDREYSSSGDVADFIDAIFDNLATIDKLKNQYLELVEAERAIEDVWEAELQDNNDLENQNRMLDNEISKHVRQIDENSRDHIKKSTEQRLHMVKLMHFCPEPKKAAARFLIEEMLNIEQEVHKFRINNEETHKKISKIISQSEKLKRENEYFSEILFSQDEYGHHFDNMKIVINQLIEKIAEERNIDNLNDCLKMIDDTFMFEIMIQTELDRKKGLKESMRKIGQMGIAPGQIKIDERNPLCFFGDLFTNKQIEVEKRKVRLIHLQNESNALQGEIRLLEEKKGKISQTLQKYKVEQLSEAKKYLGTY